MAVLFAANASGDENLNDRRWQIADLMIADLEQSKYLRILSLERLLLILTRLGQINAQQHLSGTLDKIASSEYIDYFVLPSFVKAGEKLGIRAEIRKAGSMGAADSFEVEMRNEDLVAVVQELTSRVRTFFVTFPEDTAGEYNRDLSQIATPSLPALGNYVESERLYAVNDFKGSVRALEKAVQSDPEYAKAYWKLAVNYGYLGNLDLAKKNIEKALSLLARVSLRDRYLIQGLAAQILDNSAAKAIESYNKLLALYPSDEAGLSYLGSIYRNMEEWDEAIGKFEETLKINPNAPVPYENLAFLYTAEGRYDKALDHLRIGASMFPEISFFPKQTFMIHIIQGQYDVAAAEIDQALIRSPRDVDLLEYRGIIDQLRGDLTSARAAYERLLKNEVATRGLRGWIRLGYVSSLQGRFEQGRNDFQKSIEIAQQLKMENEEIESRWASAYLLLQSRRFAEAADALNAAMNISRGAGRSINIKSPLYLLGIVELRRGRIGEAKDAARQLQQLVEKIGYRKYMRYVHHLQGRIALAEGRPAEAVGGLENALALLPAQRERWDEHAFFMEPLAEAYERAGDLDKATDTYRKILALTTGRLRWGEIYARSHYRLGLLSLKRNASREAASFFEKFLELGKNADPGLPEIEDAKKQLAALNKLPQP